MVAPLGEIPRPADDARALELESLSGKGMRRKMDLSLPPDSEDLDGPALPKPGAGELRLAVYVQPAPLERRVAADRNQEMEIARPAAR